MLINMLKNLVIFGSGVYTGVYYAQNYQVDKVEDPVQLFEKAQTYVRNKLSEMNDKKGDK